MRMKSVDRGDIWVRCHGPYKKGLVYQGHRHWIDHDSYVHPGTILIVRYRTQKEGPVIKETIYEGPCRFLVAAGLFHEIEIVSEEAYWDCEFKKPEPDSPLNELYNQEMLD